MKKGIAGLLLFTMVCIAACHKTVIRPTVYQQFTTDSLKIVDYLAAHNINAIRHDSVWYVIEQAGAGPFPTRFNCVTIKYTGYELTALQATEGTPAPFQVNTDGLKGPLKGLVGGMQIALKKFPAGTKGAIYIPSFLAYGTGGRLDTSGTYVVHPNECLLFEIELVSLSDYNVEGNYCY